MTAPNSDPVAERVLIVLADISGYTDFMLANQLALTHGQQLITSLIEALIAEVEIPLELQEIEGDALFLYARHPGDDAGWSETCTEVARKLPRFFEAFADRLIREKESTLCRCGSCRNADRLNLKAIVHSGEALFHRIDRFHSISGVDVILAHRLLKNGVDSDEYLLLTDAARRDLPLPASLEFDRGREAYEGFGEITTWVHHLSDPRPEARERLFEGSAVGVAGRAVIHNVGALYDQFPALARSGALARRHGMATSAVPRVATGLMMALVAPFELLLLPIFTPIQVLRRRRRVRGGPPEPQDSPVVAKARFWKTPGWTALAMALFCLALVAPWAEVFHEGLSVAVPMPPLPDGPASPRGRLPKGMGEADQSLVAWQVARNARTLLTRPGQLFETGQCHPTPKMLALGEPMITLGILGMPFALLSPDPIWTFNGVLILSMLLAPLAMFLLVTDWTGNPAAGLVAGLLYGFHPDKIQDVNHLYIDDTTWTVCALLFARRYFAGGRWRDALLFAAFCALQIGGSFYPFIGSVLVAIPMMVWLLLRYGAGNLLRPAASTAFILILVAAFVVFGPFLAMRSEGVLVERTLRYFAQWNSLLPGGNRFPGWIAVTLAAVSLASLRRHTLKEKPQIFLLIACALVACTAVSNSVVWDGPPLYEALARVVPGLDSVRRPNEILAGFHVGFSILAGLGCAELLRRLPRSIAPYCVGILVIVTFAAMVRPVWLGRVLPGLGSPTVYRPLELRPRRAVLDFFDELAERGNRGPIAEAPDGSLGVDAARLVASGFHRRATSACVNRNAVEHKEVEALLAALPEHAAILGLRDMGFTTILAHHPPVRPADRKLNRALERVSRQPDSPIEVVLKSRGMTAYGIRDGD